MQFCDLLKDKGMKLFIFICCRYVAIARENWSHIFIIILSRQEFNWLFILFYWNNFAIVAFVICVKIIDFFTFYLILRFWSLRLIPFRALIVIKIRETQCNEEVFDWEHDFIKYLEVVQKDFWLAVFNTIYQLCYSIN